MAYVPSATRTAAAAKAAVTAKSAKIESKAAEPVQAVTGLVFEPFSAVQGELATVNKTQEALVRGSARETGALGVVCLVASASSGSRQHFPLYDAV